MPTASCRFLTKKEICFRLGISRATFERLVADKRLSQPYKLSKRAVRWRDDEIEAYIATLPRMDDAYVRHNKKNRT